MAHLPPVGWADVATKRDLEHLEYRIGERLHREINRTTHLFIAWLLTSNLGMAGAIIAAVKLT